MCLHLESAADDAVLEPAQVRVVGHDLLVERDVALQRAVALAVCGLGVLHQGEPGEDVAGVADDRPDLFRRAVDGDVCAVGCHSHSLPFWCSWFEGRATRRSATSTRSAPMTSGGVK